MIGNCTDAVIFENDSLKVCDLSGFDDAPVSCLNSRNELLLIGKYNGRVYIARICQAHDNNQQLVHELQTVIKPNDREGIIPVTAIAINPTGDKVSIGTAKGVIHLFALLVSAGSKYQCTPISSYYNDHDCQVTFLKWSHGVDFSSSQADVDQQSRLYAGSLSGRVTMYEIHGLHSRPERKSIIDTNIKRENIKRYAFSLASQFMDYVVTGHPTERGTIVGEFRSAVHQLDCSLLNRDTSSGTAHGSYEVQERLLVSAGSRSYLCQQIHLTKSYNVPEFEGNDCMTINILPLQPSELSGDRPVSRSKSSNFSNKVSVLSMSSAVFWSDMSSLCSETGIGIVMYHQQRHGSNIAMPVITLCNIDGIMLRQIPLLPLHRDDAAMSKALTSLGCKSLVPLPFQYHNNDAKKNVLLALQENDQLTVVDLDSMTIDVFHHLQGAQDVQSVSCSNDMICLLTYKTTDSADPLGLGITTTVQMYKLPTRQQSPQMNLDVVAADRESEPAGGENSISGRQLAIDDHEALGVGVNHEEVVVNGDDPQLQQAAVESSHPGEDIFSDLDVSEEVSWLRDAEGMTWLDHWWIAAVDEGPDFLMSFGSVKQRLLAHRLATSQDRKVPEIIDFDHFQPMELWMLPPNCYEVQVVAPQGIGLHLVMHPRDGNIIVEAFNLLPNGQKGPAELSGKVALGDHLVAVNGVSVVGISLDKVSASLKQLHPDDVIILRFAYGDSLIETKRSAATLKAGRASQDNQRSASPLEIFNIFGFPEPSPLSNHFLQEDFLEDGSREETFADTMYSIVEGLSMDSKDAVGMVVESIGQLSLLSASKYASSSNNVDHFYDAEEAMRDEILEKHMYPPAAVLSLFRPSMLSDFKSQQAAVSVERSFSQVNTTEQFQSKLIDRSMSDVLWEWRQYHRSTWDAGFFRSNEFPRTIRSARDSGKYKDVRFIVRASEISQREFASVKGPQFQATHNATGGVSKVVIIPNGITEDASAGVSQLTVLDRARANKAAILKQLLDTYKAAIESSHGSAIEYLRASSGGRSSSDITDICDVSNSVADEDEEAVECDTQVWKTVDTAAAVYIEAVDPSARISPYEKLYAELQEAVAAYNNQSSRSSSTPSMAKSLDVASTDVGYAELKWYLPPVAITWKLFEYISFTIQSFDYSSQPTASNQRFACLLALWRQLFQPLPGIHRSKLCPLLVSSQYAAVHGFSSSTQMCDFLELVSELVTASFLLFLVPDAVHLVPRTQRQISSEEWLSNVEPFELALLKWLPFTIRKRRSHHSTTIDVDALFKYEAYFQFDALCVMFTLSRQPVALLSGLHVVTEMGNSEQLAQLIMKTILESNIEISMKFLYGEMLAVIKAHRLRQCLLGELAATAAVDESRFGRHTAPLDTLLLSVSNKLSERNTFRATNALVQRFPLIDRWHVEVILFGPAGYVVTSRSASDDQQRHERKWCDIYFYYQFLRGLMAKHRVACSSDREFVHHWVAVSLELWYHYEEIQIDWRNQSSAGLEGSNHRPLPAKLSLIANVRRVLRRSDMFNFDFVQVIKICHHFGFREGCLEALRQHYQANDSKLLNDGNVLFLKTVLVGCLESLLGDVFISIIDLHSLEEVPSGYSERLVALNMIGQELALAIRLFVYQAIESNEGPLNEGNVIPLLAEFIDSRVKWMTAGINPNDRTSVIMHAAANAVGTVILKALCKESALQLVGLSSFLLDNLSLAFYINMT